jgi:hypothetical protein
VALPVFVIASSVLAAPNEESELIVKLPNASDPVVIPHELDAYDLGNIVVGNRRQRQTAIVTDLSLLRLAFGKRIFLSTLYHLANESEISKYGFP